MATILMVRMVLIMMTTAIRIMMLIMIKTMLRMDHAIGDGNITMFTIMALIMIMLTVMALIMTMFTIPRMLTGDEVASDGVASILGHQLDSDRRTFLSQIGYCPQFDSIIPQVMTMG